MNGQHCISLLDGKYLHYNHLKVHQSDINCKDDKKGDDMIILWQVMIIIYPYDKYFTSPSWNSVKKIQIARVTQNWRCKMIMKSWRCDCDEKFLGLSSWWDLTYLFFRTLGCETIVYYPQHFCSWVALLCDSEGPASTWPDRLMMPAPQTLGSHLPQHSSFGPLWQLQERLKVNFWSKILMYVARDSECPMEEIMQF